MMKTAFSEQHYKNDAVRERIKRNKRAMNLEDNLKDVTCPYLVLEVRRAHLVEDVLNQVIFIILFYR